MRDGPNIATIAALIGDPTRAEVLTALLAGQALTATELAGRTDVTKQTMSAHLGKLVGAGLCRVEAQGRHRYYRLADDDVAELVEALMGVAFRAGAVRLVTGPSEPALRMARVCYDHLAGTAGVEACDAMVEAGILLNRQGSLVPGPLAESFFSSIGANYTSLQKGRRTLCRSCLDWSERRSHLAGALGASLYQQIISNGWAKRVQGSRTVLFERHGRHALFAAIAASRRRAP
jgi:DNA-binding transcriptional ArsR family regulator